MYKDKYGGPDRRRSQRMRVDFIVVYRIRRPIRLFMVIKNKEVSALMADLSEGGMAILTSYDIPISTTLLIKFTLINPPATEYERLRMMEIAGEVRYNTYLGNNEHRLGICFTHISKEDRAAIVNFIKTAIDQKQG